MRLEVITGPMFAGKTHALVERAKARDAHEVAAFRLVPWLESPTAPGWLEPRGGVPYPAMQLRLSRVTPSEDTLRIEHTLSAALERHPLVLVDEAHFSVAPGFGLHERRFSARTLVLAGLSLTWDGKPWEPFAWLVHHADDVRVLRARCARCGGAAMYSQLAQGSAERVVRDTGRNYEPRCRACWEVA